MQFTTQRQVDQGADGTASLLQDLLRFPRTYMYRTHEAGGSPRVRDDGNVVPSTWSSLYFMS